MLYLTQRLETPAAATASVTLPIDVRVKSRVKVTLNDGREAGLLLPRGLLLRGWMINALNPKGTVFMLAVVPQFLDLSRPLPLQYAAITATLCFTEMLVMTGYMTLAARVLGLLRTPRQMGWLNRSFGGLFMAAAALLATFKRAV